MIKEFKGEYRWLSNFAPVNITFMGRTFPSIEHAYMSAKSNSINWIELCQDKNNSASVIKRLSKTIDIRLNWESWKIEVMKRCVKRKFEQEPYKSLLKSTGDCYIQEGNLWNDTFWGVCLKTGKGKNILGNIIMDIRKTI